MTDEEINAQAGAKSAAEREELLTALRNRTALGRLNLTEAYAVFDLIGELGYTLTKPAA